MSSQKYFSQYKQDKFLSERIFQNKLNGSYVDVGAHDGISLSNTYFFEKELGWNGVCIESNPLVYQKLIQNRNCLNLNYCVTNSNETKKFLAVHGYGEMLSGLEDFMNEHHLNRIDKLILEYGGGKETISVPGKPLKDIFNEQKITFIDYCNIDVEGGEIGVLKSIDFSKVRISLFTVENNNKTRIVREFLKKEKYSLIAITGDDEVYEYSSKRYLMIMLLNSKILKNKLIISLKKIISKSNF